MLWQRGKGVYIQFEFSIENELSMIRFDDNWLKLSNFTQYHVVQQYTVSKNTSTSPTYYNKKCYIVCENANQQFHLKKLQKMCKNQLLYRDHWSERVKKFRANIPCVKGREG